MGFLPGRFRPPPAITSNPPCFFEECSPFIRNNKSCGDSPVLKVREYSRSISFSALILIDVNFTQGCFYYTGRSDMFAAQPVSESRYASVSRLFSNREDR